MLWLGADAFFVVRGAQAVELPRRHEDLPPWVVELLDGCLASSPLLRANLRARLTERLEAFTGRPVSRALEVLRTVHWGALPLRWEPLALRTLPWSVGIEECQQAQRRLVRSAVQAAHPGDAAGTEGLERATQGLLAQLTGMSAAFTSPERDTGRCT